MLSLEEAIRHCEEVAKTCEMEVLERSNLPFSVVGYEDAKKRDLDRKRECASEHRQLAEWLRELKKLREIPNKLVPKYRDGIQDEYNRGANEMLEEVIDDIRKYTEEVNADED